jgi:hypothetical protein
VVIVTMYDSTVPSAIPTDATVVAGYLDGAFAWHPTDWVRFPLAQKVGILTSPSSAVPGLGVYSAIVLDVENHDARPADVGAFLAEAQAAGWLADQRVIYCDLSTLPAVKAAVMASGRGAVYWTADPGATGLTPGADATQYQYPPNTPGYYDLSLTAQGWPPLVSTTWNAPPVSFLVVPAARGVGSSNGLTPVWIFHADGGVGAYNGAPFDGSYPGLPAGDRQDAGALPFIGAFLNGSNSYTLVGSDGTQYAFPV